MYISIKKKQFSNIVVSAVVSENSTRFGIAN